MDGGLMTAGGGATVNHVAESALRAVPDGSEQAAVLARAALMTGVPEIVSGAWRLASFRLDRLRKQRGKRIVDCVVAYEDARTGEARVDALIVKFYGSDRAAAADRALHELWANGFRPPSPFRVPRPYGQSSEYGALLQSRIEGVSWADHLDAPRVELERASAAAAEWLLRLHGSGALVPVATVDHDVAEVRRFAAELGASFPPYERPLGALSERIAGHLGGSIPAPRPSHGDYHPKNVFLDSAGAAVIDFDTFAAREPAWDIGYGLGQLLCMSLHRSQTLQPGVEAGIAFWDHYAANADPPPWQRVSASLARTLMQSLHYELCTLANNRTGLLDLWPALIKDALESETPENLADRLRGR